MQPHTTAITPDLSTDAFHRKAVERVIRTVRECEGPPLTLEEMAKVALISPYHFIRIFHRLTGVPPNRYQWAIRVAFAKRLLVETDMSIIDVCFEAGYNSLGTFTRRFTKLVGMPPHHFRLAAREFDPESLNRMVVRMSSANRAWSFPSPRVFGEVSAPAGWRGIIFVGLFPAELNHGLPPACCVLTGPGPYAIVDVPDGSYHLHAVGICRHAAPSDYLLYDHALRASVDDSRIEVRAGSVSHANTDLMLRGHRPTDMPILMALAPLLKQRLHDQRSMTAGMSVLNGRSSILESSQVEIAASAHADWNSNSGEDVGP